MYKLSSILCDNQVGWKESVILYPIHQGTIRTKEKSALSTSYLAYFALWYQSKIGSTLSRGDPYGTSG